jgi:uncharacterized integral membrane protein
MLTQDHVKCKWLDLTPSFFDIVIANKDQQKNPVSFAILIIGEFQIPLNLIMMTPIVVQYLIIIILIMFKLKLKL